jgi:hypothetical protein
VLVPDWLTKQPQLVLQIGLDMPVAIPDLRVDDDGVFGTLSFNRAPFTCSVGWAAVFALVGDDGKGMVWPDDIPPEIAEEVDRGTTRARPPHAGLRALDNAPSMAAERKSAPARSALQLASAANVREPDGSDDLVASGRTRLDTDGKRKLPPYLRVIK